MGASVVADILPGTRLRVTNTEGLPEWTSYGLLVKVLKVLVDNRLKRHMIVQECCLPPIGTALRKCTVPETHLTFSGMVESMTRYRLLAVIDKHKRRMAQRTVTCDVSSPF